MSFSACLFFLLFLLHLNIIWKLTFGVWLVAVNLSRHDSSASVQSATTFVTPPPTSTSVSMRDVGTEMTPIASQEPSRTATPVRATTPMRSPNSSQPSTPRRAAQNSDPIESIDCHGGSSNTELSEKDLQMRTRKEIMILGTKLGKTNIAAWASKEEEEIDESSLLKIAPVSQTSKSVIEARASAWEEAEKAKYLARLIYLKALFPFIMAYCFNS